MKRIKQRGFTLLELLIILAIIGALAIIAIPQYSSYREKAEKASMISDARALYRAFVIFYLEHQEYPYVDPWAADPPMQFNKNTFTPLTLPGYMGDLPFDIEVEQFRDKLDGRKAERFESPDDMGLNQEFYVILPWAKDPNIKFVVASSDNVLYGDDTVVDGGNWIDGVFITEGGTILNR